MVINMVEARLRCKYILVTRTIGSANHPILTMCVLVFILCSTKEVLANLPYELLIVDGQAAPSEGRCPKEEVMTLAQ